MQVRVVREVRAAMLVREVKIVMLVRVVKEGEHIIATTCKSCNADCEIRVLACSIITVRVE